ncbi:hypothetical protein BOS5A_230217 [Bosea sp. EC-HK365B]|nr:hypothetical protein BOSE21B_90295 [Bosea sp. 21B]CAD5298409.1 hypothetical protein BOSE7B_60371 [Bosea sp. 7B]VVT60940.1 hypothetical protein BOS5A_230217 [Bosea sp. EC-HK365B]VXB35584.1 hypothetical protein BOSE127_110370 [Bosea sp. 127]
MIGNGVDFLPISFQLALQGDDLAAVNNVRELLSGFDDIYRAVCRVD